MRANIFFYVVFLSQIILLSFYFPRKMLNRIRYVFETYPPSEFPKLYPKPIEYYEKARRNYRHMNVCILLAGMLLMAVLLGYSRSGEWDGAIVNTYFMVQFFPMMLIFIGSLKYYKLMRKADVRTTRKAELRPRRLFDFISPTMIGLAMFVYFAFIVFVLYIKQFDFPWFGGYWNIVAVTATNLFFAGIIVWHLYGKKLDPYQAYEDRIREIELVVKSLVFVSIAATLFIAIVVVLASLDLRHVQPAVQSLYFQLIAVLSLRTLRIDTINFEVYKEDPNEKKSYMMSEERTENENSSHRNTGVGVGLGLSFGAALGLLFGETLFSLVIGAGLGIILGIGIGSRLDLRKGMAPNL